MSSICSTKLHLLLQRIGITRWTALVDLPLLGQRSPGTSHGHRLHPPRALLLLHVVEAKVHEGLEGQLNPTALGQEALRALADVLKVRDELHERGKIGSFIDTVKALCS